MNSADHVLSRDDKAYTLADAEFAIGEWLHDCQTNGFRHDCPQHLQDFVTDMGWMRQPIGQGAGQYAAPPTGMQLTPEDKNSQRTREAVDAFLLDWKKNDGGPPPKSWSHTASDGIEVSLGRNILYWQSFSETPRHLAKDIVKDFIDRGWIGENALPRGLRRSAHISQDESRDKSYWKKVYEAAAHFASINSTLGLNHVPSRGDKAYTLAGAEFAIGEWIEDCQTNGFRHGCPPYLQKFVTDMGWMNQPIGQGAGQYAPQQNQAATNALPPQHPQHTAPPTQRQVAAYAMLGSQTLQPTAANPAGPDQSQTPLQVGAFGVAGTLFHSLSVEPAYWQPPVPQPGQPGQASRPPGQPGQGNTPPAQRRGK
ncbi:hypothetical protein [Streptomyces sp. NPDC059850]|uniref:hypothetical protein n=1 Tax=Streptomyces sp. NPDC059850 TaxID=3346970 RepID=UPI00364B849A